MDTSKPDDNPVFDHRTLRLIVGVLAFAFPAMVCALTGRITASISASYHEAETRDVFVGFLFIIGALLISYKGHIRKEPGTGLEGGGKVHPSSAWIKRYQEDLVSTIGGLAAIFTALYPTTCDGCVMDARAAIHMFGAFLLFSTVVYFCMIAFLRRVNQKLLADPGVEKSSGFRDRIDSLKAEASREDVLLPVKVWNFITLEIRIFLAIAAAEMKRADGKNQFVKFVWLTRAYDGKFDRGMFYVACGSLITVTLLSFLVLLVAAPDQVAGSSATFIVESIALGLFGIAWMKASQLKYFQQIKNWLAGGGEKTSAGVRQTDPA